MGLREEFQKRIDKKQQEIDELKRDFEVKLKEANGYLQALQDSMKLLPKDAAANSLGVSRTLRPGSALAKAREAILKAGHPLHILELLKAIGKPQDKKNRISLGGSLSGYVRDGQVFTRPSPNTFGLIELEISHALPDDEARLDHEEDRLPATFGKN